MKRLLIFAAVFFAVQACNPPERQGGVRDDGTKTVDTNGALQDTPGMKYSPKVDTAMGEDRVDIQQRN